MINKSRVLSRYSWSGGSLAILIAFGTVAAAQGVTEMKPGQGGSAVGGSATVSGSSGVAPTLEKCTAPLGTIAVAEPQEFVAKALLKYSLPSPTGLIRLMIQQSDCFLVVERGVAMQNILQERRLQEQGQLREGAQMSGGQMVTADYVLTPDVVFSEQDAGGIGGVLGAIGGLFGAPGAIFGAIAGGLKFKQAQTTLIVADTRSGLQVTAASGSAEKADWGLGGVLGGAGSSSLGAVGLGAYENTAEGKVVAASFLDNYNQVVRSVRDSPQLQRSTQSVAQSLAQQAAPATVDRSQTLVSAAAIQPLAAAGFTKGDVLKGKIGGVRVYAQSSEKSRLIGTLSKSDEVLYTGQERDGFLNIQGDKINGWVDKAFVTKAQ